MSATPLSDADPLVGNLFAGKYRIVRKIGTGGMGAVYLAHHVLLERAVAIKVVHSRWAQTDPACLQRFRTEARASSCLNHPNIMSVFDFGITQDGTAYLVMDYIQGVGLDDILKRDRYLEPSRALDIFTQACDALAHAHERGIVHRDLKPSNIMLVLGKDGRETVKIVDFGIAKILPGRARSVESWNDDGEIIGSPLYMSPEQCMGNAQDGRSDIYSLGCLLYESLTGQPAISDRNVLGIIYRHLNESPRRFLTVAPQLNIAPQIEAVVLRALSKNPGDRHQTMRELSADLQRAYARAQKALQEFVDDKGSHSVHPAVSGMLDVVDNTDTAEEALLGSFKAAAAQLGAESPELVPILHQLADYYGQKGHAEHAEHYLRGAVEKLVSLWGPWDPRVSEAVKKLADYYRDGERYQEAEPLYLDLLTIKRKVLKSAHPDIACILLRLADIYLSTGHLTHARRYYEQCLRISEQLFGARDPVLTPVLTGLATVLGMQNEQEQAEFLYARALTIKEGQFGPDHYEIAATLLCLGVLYRQEERFREAERAFGRALTIYEQSVGQETEDVYTTVLLLAEMYSAQGLNKDAEALYRRALNVRLCVDGSDSLAVAQAYEMFAVHHIRNQSFDDAEAMYKEALAIKERLLGADHADVAESLNFLATLYHAENRFDAAEEHYKRAIAILTDLPDCGGMLSDSCRSLGDLYTDQKRYAEAEPVYLRALEGQTQNSEQSNPQARAIITSLANLYKAANSVSNTLTNIPRVKHA